MNTITEPKFFRPSLLKSQRDRRSRLFPPNAAPIVSEGRLISDISMPERDWSQFDKPACKRMTARLVRVPLSTRSFAQAS